MPRKARDAYEGYRRVDHPLAAPLAINNPPARVRQEPPSSNDDATKVQQNAPVRTPAAALRSEKPIVDTDEITIVDLDEPTRKLERPLLPPKDGARKEVTTFEPRPGNPAAGALGAFGRVEGLAGRLTSREVAAGFKAAS